MFEQLFDIINTKYPLLQSTLSHDKEMTIKFGTKIFACRQCGDASLEYLKPEFLFVRPIKENYNDLVDGIFTYLTN